MPSGPTLAMVCAAMMRARTAQRFVTGATSPRARGQQGLDGPEILLGVDSDRGLVRLEHADGDAGLEQPQLLELLRELEGRRGQGVEGPPHPAPVGADPGVRRVTA